MVVNSIGYFARKRILRNKNKTNMEITQEIEDQFKNEKHKLTIAPLSNSLDIRMDCSDYPCVNIEVWNGDFRALIYRNNQDEPEIITVGKV